MKDAAQSANLEAESAKQNVDIKKKEIAVTQELTGATARNAEQLNNAAGAASNLQSILNNAYAGIGKYSTELQEAAWNAGSTGKSLRDVANAASAFSGNTEEIKLTNEITKLSTAVDAANKEVGRLKQTAGQEFPGHHRLGSDHGHAYPYRYARQDRGDAGDH